MRNGKLISGYVGTGVAWFRIKGYGIAAIRCANFSTCNGYHKKFIKLGDWRIEALAP